MKNAPRKIDFFYLSFRDDLVLDIEQELSKVLNYLLSASKTARKIELSDDKFCFMESCDLDDVNDLHKVLFKSATHSYRAPLINRKTVEERENPKTIDEGEGKKTHLVIKYKNGDAIVLLENFQKGLSMKQVIQYLNSAIDFYNSKHKIQLIYRFDYSIIPRDDFAEVLESMSRVLCASIYVDKQVLGSNALNFSERTNAVQDDIIIEVKTKRHESIKAFSKDMVVMLGGGKSKIKKIRIKGKNEQNNDIMIETGMIIKKEYVETQMNEDTGEIITANMFSEMVELSKTF